MNEWTCFNLNHYSVEMGFESDRDRVEMILSVPQWHEDALWTWLDTDGTKQGLLKILDTKRSVRPTKEDV
jgi:hypothetical protein